MAAEFIDLTWQIMVVQQLPETIENQTDAADYCDGDIFDVFPTNPAWWNGSEYVRGISHQRLAFVHTIGVPVDVDYKAFKASIHRVTDVDGQQVGEVIRQRQYMMDLTSASPLAIEDFLADYEITRTWLPDGENPGMASLLREKGVIDSMDPKSDVLTPVY